MSYQDGLSVFEINSIHKERDKAVADLTASKAREHWLAESRANIYCSDVCNGNHKPQCNAFYWLDKAREETQ